MAKIEIGRDAVPNQALQFGEFGKAARLARPESLVVEPDLEDAASSRYECNLPEPELERGEQLLRRPCGAEKPAALRAVLDLQPGLPHRHGHEYARGPVSGRKETPHRYHCHPRVGGGSCGALLATPMVRLIPRMRYALMRARSSGGVSGKR